jgi:hypothetical protein
MRHLILELISSEVSRACARRFPLETEWIIIWVIHFSGNFDHPGDRLLSGKAASSGVSSPKRGETIIPVIMTAAPGVNNSKF